jgi:GNAT superfamily N-acetyltransferase
VTATGNGAPRVVDGRPNEAAALSALALRSKGFWGYDAAFLDACRAELTLTPDQAAAARVVRGADGTVRGFHLLGPDPGGDPGSGELLMLFVDPTEIGRGIGRALLEDAVRYAARRGWSTLRVEADPGAEAFYVAHGARRVGTVPSGSVPGRELPLLELPVA